MVYFCQDVALYKAKETGRNKCLRFAEEMWEEEQFQKELILTAGK